MSHIYIIASRAGGRTLQRNDARNKVDLSKGSGKVRVSSVSLGGDTP